MDVLWEDLDVTLTVRDVATRLPSYAYTTLLTVLDRLQHKGMVRRTKVGRAFAYRAARSREDFTADLMQDALATAPNRNAVLARFVETVSPSEAAAIRAALDASSTLARRAPAKPPKGR